MKNGDIQNHPRSKPPSAYELREQMVEAGDVQSLLDGIKEASPSEIDLGVVFRQLQRAINNALQRDPAAAINNFFQQMIAFSALIRFRVQYLCDKELASSDAVNVNRSVGLSHEFQSHLWPMAKDMDTHLSEMMQAYASSMRQMELTQRKQAKHEATATPAKKSRRSTPRSAPKARPHMTARLGAGPM